MTEEKLRKQPAKNQVLSLATCARLCQPHHLSNATLAGKCPRSGTRKLNRFRQRFQCVFRMWGRQAAPKTGTDGSATGISLNVRQPTTVNATIKKTPPRNGWCRQRKRKATAIRSTLNCNTASQSVLWQTPHCKHNRKNPTPPRGCHIAKCAKCQPPSPIPLNSPLPQTRKPESRWQSSGL